MSRVLALDLGAGSGRAVQGILRDGRIVLEEVHRFPNRAVHVRGTFYWDVLGLFDEILTSLRKACRSGTEPLGSIGIDTWGVDFGILDSAGNLLSNPVHYRDDRTRGMMELSHRLAGPETVFSLTGIQDMFFNTSFQLMGLKNRTEGLPATGSILFTPDLLNYFLTGQKKTERTIASTSQLLGAGPDGVWSKEVFDRLGLSGVEKLFPEIVPPGTVVGPLGAEVADDVGAGSGGPVVVAVASHDTASAVAAVQEEKEAFLVCGTWSILGTSSPEPFLSTKAREAGFSNESGYEGSTCFLKNIMGLWILQEYKRFFEVENPACSWTEISARAEKAPPFRSWIDCDDALFAPPGDMAVRITEFCRRKNQPVPATVGEISRCVLESLAMRYRQTLDQMESLTGKKIETVNLVGGGSQNALLCQFTADACGRPVKAGPVEASSLGNIGVQLVALGKLESAEAMRSVVRKSFVGKVYTPQNSKMWSVAFSSFRRYTSD